MQIIHIDKGRIFSCEDGTLLNITSEEVNAQTLGKEGELKEKITLEKNKKIKAVSTGNFKWVDGILRRCFICVESNLDEIWLTDDVDTPLTKKEDFKDQT